MADRVMQELAIVPPVFSARALGYQQDVDGELVPLPRHEFVLGEIQTIRGDIMRRALYLGNLLVEIEDEQHYLKYGYPSLPLWLEHGSGLDISATEARYLRRLTRRSRQLGIPESDLLKVKLSKLKKIFTLSDDEASPDVIKALVQSAEVLSLKAVNETVNFAKKMDFEFRTMKWDREAFNNVIAPALERMRREYGGTVDDEGQEQDITDSRATEMIFADYLSQAEETEEDIIEGHYSDSFSQEDEEESFEPRPVQEVMPANPYQRPLAVQAL